MSKFIFGSVSRSGGLGIGLEDEEIEMAPDSEELAIISADSQADAAAAAADVESAQRLEEQAEGLEDAAAVLDDHVDSATPGEVMLTDVASSLATAGTDAEVPVLDDAPEGEQASVESFTGRRISTEGMKETAKSFWDAIVRLIKRAWEWLVSFYRKVTSEIPGVAKQARKLTARAEGIQKSGKIVKQKKTELGSEGATLVVADAAPTNYASIATMLENCKTIGNNYFVDHAKMIIDSGDDIASAISSFDIDTADASLTKVNQAARSMTLDIKRKGNTKLTSDKRFSDGYDVYRSAGLPGNKAVFYSGPGANTGNDSLATAASRRAVTVTVMGYSDAKEKSRENIKVDTFKASDVISMCDKIEDLCDMLAKFEKNQWRKLEKTGDKLKKACEKLTANIDDDTKAIDAKMYRAATQYATSFAGWATNPFCSILKTTLAGCRAAMVAGGKCLSNYGTND